MRKGIPLLRGGGGEAAGVCLFWAFPIKKSKKMVLSIEILTLFLYNTFVVRKKMFILEYKVSLWYAKKARGGDNAKK